MKLPKSKQQSPEWLAATEALLMVAEDRGPSMQAHAGMMLTLHGAKPIPGPHLVCGFLTTAPNAIVEPIHPKAMPVILTTQEECDCQTYRRHLPGRL